MQERLIVYGDCQAQALHGVLCRSPQVCEHFSVELHFVGEQERAWPSWLKAMAGAAAIFIQDIPQSRAHPNYHLPATKRPRQILFPALSLPSLWPFSTAFGGRDAVAESVRAEAHGAGLHSDALLGTLRCIPDHTRRLAAYLNLERDVNAASTKLIGRREPVRFHELDELRLRQMDERVNSNVGRYILHNFRRRRLFHIVRHPTLELIQVVGKELFEKLGGLSFELDSSRDDNAYYQVPIHPLVARDLGVGWIKKDEKYQVFDDRLSIEDYTLRYMALYG